MATNIDEICVGIGLDLADAAALVSSGKNDSLKKMENILHRVRDVLFRNGVYAYFIYLRSKSGRGPRDSNRSSSEDEKFHRLILRNSLSLLMKLGFINIGDLTQDKNEESIIYEYLDRLGDVSREPGNFSSVLDKFIIDVLPRSNDIFGNVVKIFLIKELLEKMLSYALLSIKAKLSDVSQ